MTIKSVEARCLNRRTEVKAEDAKCRKCGDPVAIRRVQRRVLLVPTGTIKA